MRTSKTFCIAAFCVAFAMALAGTASAMAESTQLCENDVPEACKEPMTIHFVTAKNGFVLLSEALSIECTALLAGKVLLGLVSKGPVVVHVAASELVFTECGACSVTTLTGGLVEFLRLSHEFADVTITGFEVHTNCSGLFDCTYASKNLVNHSTGPLLEGGMATGSLTYEKVPVKSVEGGEACPTAELDALFQSLKALYFRA